MNFQQSTFDISHVKSHETLQSGEVQVRIVAAFLTLIIGIWWPQIPFAGLTIWTLSYVGAVLAIAFTATWMPGQVSFKTWLLIMILYSIEVGIFVTLPIFLWTQGTQVFMVFAMCFWAGLMLHVLGFPEMGGERRFVLVLMVGVQGGFYALWWAASGHDVVSYVSLFAGLSVVYGYFLFSTYRLVRVRAQNAELIRNRIAAERSAAVGTLTGGVAHDFNNLLTVVLGNLELTREISDPSERQDLVEEAYRAAERGANLTSDLLSFSRKDVLTPREVDLNAAIENAAEFIRRVIPSQIRIEFRLSMVDLPRPMIDLTKFETMLLNLVANARDAMPQGGLLEITTSTSRDDQWVIMTVNDTGEGIPDSVLPRVTDPFFTTKPHGKGTGLGLSMARGFVEQSGGSFSIDSQEGEGTWITIRLPNPHYSAEAKATAKVKAQSKAQPSLRNSSTMLRMPSSGT